MLLSMQKVKEMYSISRRTLINWEKEGLITPVKTPKGIRRYKKEDIEKLLGMLEENPKPKSSFVCKSVHKETGRISQESD
ncbi:MerR-like DNA binding protein [Caldanaerobacter subterraneus]|uniref:MerR-like DNA binding protein n=1 Tax=Caldanaerobacter subterraneus TaxID=911092 RepID=A0A4R2KAQ0_9THEO|nr:MerR-like DNA binding protein [Caldanaerobacter subterraneus]